MKTTFRNQRAITINRNMPQKGENRKFLSAHYDAITKASRNLSGDVAFKLYIYLLSNQDKYVDNFSPANFSKEFGVSIDRCRKVFGQLEEVGYLIKCGNNEYQFYEEPQAIRKLASLPMSKERRKAEFDDGTFEYVSYEEFYAQFKNNYPDSVIVEAWNQLEKEEEC